METTLAPARESIPVRFLRRYRHWNTNEVAGFEPARAQELIDTGVAEPVDPRRVRPAKPQAEPRRVAVRLLAKYRQFNRGEVVGLLPKDAQELVKGHYAEYVRPEDQPVPVQMPPELAALLDGIPGEPRVTVRLLGKYRQFNRGEVAGFPRTEAQRLVEAGAAEYVAPPEPAKEPDGQKDKGLKGPPGDKMVKGNDAETKTKEAP